MPFQYAIKSTHMTFGVLVQINYLKWHPMKYISQSYGFNLFTNWIFCIILCLSTFGVNLNLRKKVEVIMIF